MRHVVGKIRVALNRVIGAVGLDSFLQRGAERYWSSTHDTYVAPPEYYNARQVVLRETLERIGRVSTALDQGCGDGRFTLVIAEYADAVDGFDISPSLIQQAQEAARSQSLDWVNFAVGELEGIPARHYGLVACMGVTACIHETKKYERVLDQLVAAVEPGGHLILIDTVSSRFEVTRAYKSGYVGRYRREDKYLSALTTRGLTLESTVTLADWSDELHNRLWLFAKGHNQ